VLLLALDTSSPSVGAAVLSAPAPEQHRPVEVLAESEQVDARRHGELLAPAVADALSAAGVDRHELELVAVGVGPGPFTGLRVGLVTARTLGAVLGIDVVGVCSLDALALGAWRQGLLDGRSEVLVAGDARRREVHWATYELAAYGPVRRQGPGVARPADLPDDVRALARAGVVGRGAVVHAAELGPALGPLDPAAADVGRWAVSGRPVLPPEPLYLRRPDAAEPHERKRVLS
jgi:tRNA threonylcarbamoyl adenosine modification protein YeaZ